MRGAYRLSKMEYRFQFRAGGSPTMKNISKVAVALCAISLLASPVFAQMSTMSKPMTEKKTMMKKPMAKKIMMKKKMEKKTMMKKKMMMKKPMGAMTMKKPGSTM
jgi:hypothetical protein